MRATRLLFSAIWLAGSSVFLSLTLYVLGAREVAVIELSVGAGLVAVLFVFAIAVAGDDGIAARSLVPRWLAGGLLVLALLLLGWLGLTVVPPMAPSAEPPFGQVLWEQRSLDVLLQVVIVFAGVMGVLLLLGGSALAVRPVEAVAERHEPSKVAEPVKEISPVAEPVLASAGEAPSTDGTGDRERSEDGRVAEPAAPAGASR